MKDVEKIIERVVPIGLGTAVGAVMGKKLGAPKRGAAIGAGVGIVYGSTLKSRREAKELAAENEKLRNELLAYKYDFDDDTIKDDSESSSPSIFNEISSEEEESTIDE